MFKELSPASRALCILGETDPRVTLRFTISFMLSPAPLANQHRWKSQLMAMAVLLAFLLSNANAIFGQRKARTVAPATGSLTITSEPNTIIWIDEIRRGVTDTSGRIELKTSAGRHTLRARALGFKEVTVPLVAGKRSVAIKLIRTTDQAELTFQEAEDAREKARDDAARQKAAELYRAALELRPANSQAHVGLARVLLDLSQHQAALEEIDEARTTRPAYAEASAVEGRINRDAGFTDGAIASFRRAIREARGFQPEAHVGLARVFEDKGQNEEAIVEYRKAIDQLSDSEPVIYQLLGAIYEKQQKFKEAVAAYEKYLALAPNGSLAPAIRSIIEQVRRDAAGQEIIP
ncbi:MAG TPA: tetratricopeptide repeat protein [Pyrinomonadaceae bacterium]|nr:tetratricopeptide repeat protein [Pyrinomonadaceae bacterium]